MWVDSKDLGMRWEVNLAYTVSLFLFFYSILVLNFKIQINVPKF
jgi:hypothetical protein